MHCAAAPSGPPSGVGVQLSHQEDSSLNAPTAYEQLTLLEPQIPDGGLTPLGIPGFAGFFLSQLEEPANQGGPWSIAITPAFAGADGDLLIVAARDDDHVQSAGPAVEAAITVFREAIAVDRTRRQTQRVIAGVDA